MYINIYTAAGAWQICFTSKNHVQNSAVKITPVMLIWHAH